MGYGNTEAIDSVPPIVGQYLHTNNRVAFFSVAFLAIRSLFNEFLALIRNVWADNWVVQ